VSGSHSGLGPLDHQVLAQLGAAHESIGLRRPGLLLLLFLLLLEYVGHVDAGIGGGDDDG